MTTRLTACQRQQARGLLRDDGLNNRLCTGGTEQRMPLREAFQFALETLLVVLPHADVGKRRAQQPCAQRAAHGAFVAEG